MTDHNSEAPGSVPQTSEEFGRVPKSSEGFGNVPQGSEAFGKIPQPSETFRAVRNISERTQNHTLTVREVARLFEQAGVPRTERSIINWCQLNRQGVARLDAFFDENEGRYYVTPQSVTRAIEEERAKQPAPESGPVSERTVPNASETSRRPSAPDDASELERKNRDLEITTRAKDYYIERLQKEREQFHNQLVGMSRYVGELESQVLQLGGAPRGDRSLPQRSESVGSVPSHSEMNPLEERHPQ